MGWYEDAGLPARATWWRPPTRNASMRFFVSRGSNGRDVRETAVVGAEGFEPSLGTV